MGEIIGAGIISHVPTIMLPKEERLELNNGNDFTLVTGMQKLRSDILDPLKPDTIVIFDTHWHTTFDTVVDGREYYKGFHTSDELPRSLCDIPYDYAGDPELANLIEEVTAEKNDTWIHVSRNPHLPIHYGTVNLVHYLNRGEKILSISCAQTGESEDFLKVGKVVREAIEKSNRRVVLLGSGGLSHRFWPISVIRQHESAELRHVISPEARAMDEKVIGLLAEGKHKEVIELMPKYRQHAPEGRFGHYLMMASALGGSQCTAPGIQFSEYEASVGTGQVHIWFDKPEDGWVS
jgi:3,4-dihydroxyphenylacetate 2,3-dioxygenase